MHAGSEYVPRVDWSLNTCIPSWPQNHLGHCVNQIMRHSINKINESGLNKAAIYFFLCKDVQRCVGQGMWHLVLSTGVCLPTLMASSPPHGSGLKLEPHEEEGGGKEACTPPFNETSPVPTLLNTSYWLGHN